MQFMQPKEQVHWEVEEIDDEGNPVAPSAHHDEL